MIFDDNSFYVVYTAKTYSNSFVNGIVVTHNPGANADSVADTTIGLMLAVLEKIARLDRIIRQGGWTREPTLDMHGKV